MDKTIEVVNGWPPNIEDIKKVFDLSNKRPVFTYGTRIYNPYQAFIDEPLRIHELTHVAQQGLKYKQWWRQYLRDPVFRLAQEVEAYHNQYMCFQHWMKDKNATARFVHRLAVDLSSEMYGNMISYSEALRAIKNYK